MYGGRDGSVSLYRCLLANGERFVGAECGHRGDVWRDFHIDVSVDCQPEIEFSNACPP